MTRATYEDGVSVGVAPAPSTGRSDVTPSVLGAVVTVVGLALTILSAIAINDLAQRRLGAGLTILGAVVVVRGLLADALERWSALVARRRRGAWRSRVVTFFLLPASPSGPSPVDIAASIDTIADEPRLAMVRASTAASTVSLVVVWWAGGWQALGIVLVLLAVAVPFYQRAGQRAVALEGEYRQRRTRLGERQLELLTHAPELRALGAVDYGAGEIVALSTAEHHVALRAIRSALGSSLVTEFLGGVSVGLVAMSVGFGLLNGRISLLRAVIAVLLTSDFFAHVRRFGTEFHRRESIAAARERLTGPVTPPMDLATGAAATALLLQTHELVTRAHPTPLTLEVRAGDRVAVLGASGVGKTTLAHTLIGWRRADRGSVMRSSDAVGYVSADTRLLEGTLGENLRLGRDVSEERVVAQLVALGLIGPPFSDLTSAVSADGEGFSSGERVRLVLARALLHEPAVLILDDVAGLLDDASRRAVRRDLAGFGELAIIEVAVDAPVFIEAAIMLRLS